MFQDVNFYWQKTGHLLSQGVWVFCNLFRIFEIVYKSPYQYELS